MGRAPSIQTLAAQNAEFDKYMVEAVARLRARAQPDRDKFQASIESYYGQNSWDQQPLGQGGKDHLFQSKSFSLKGIDAFLKDFTNAVFGGGKAPEGSVVEAGEKVAKAVLALTEFQALALVAATSFVQTLLGAFDTSVKLDFDSSWQSQSLAPGLTLHAWKMSDSFRSKDFFNNESIVEIAIDFKLIYSFAQAGMQSDIVYFQSQSTALEGKETALLNMESQYNTKLEDINTPAEELDSYENRITRISKNLQQYRTHIDDLKTKYQNA